MTQKSAPKLWLPSFLEFFSGMFNIYLGIVKYKYTVLNDYDNDLQKRGSLTQVRRRTHIHKHPAGWRGDWTPKKYMRSHD